MGNSEEQRKIMLPGKWREKMVEEDHGLWTVECLRGRLLAERVASKAAKQDAEFIGNKLLELEQHLRLEIKAKDKAEKKLKFLMGKLESLKVSHLQNHSGSSSVYSEVSSCSSTASSGISIVGEQMPTSQMKNLVKCKSQEDMSDASSLTSEDLQNINSETSDIANPGSKTPSVSSPVSANRSCEIEEDTYSKDSDICDNNLSEELKKDDLRRTATKNGEKNKAEECVDNPLPNPRVVWPTSKNQINNDTDRDTLVALKHVREQLQNPLRKGNVNNSRTSVLCTGI